MPRLLRALVVDDSGFTRRVIMKCLRETGLADFQFTEAVDGLDALEKFQPEVTDIIFVDLNMPRMDGVEFLRRLRLMHAQCPPVVLITSEESHTRLADAVNAAGADALLLKPVDAGRLRNGLRRLVEAIPERGGSWTVSHGECVALAVQAVIGQSFGLALTPEPPPVGSGGGNVVFGLVTVLGDVQWSVVLGFEESAAAGVASRMAGFEIPFDSPDIGDAIGEVTSLVAGQMKRMLVARGLSVDCSLPTVIGASQIRFLVQRGRRTTADQVHYLTPVGRLWVAVSVGLAAGLVL
jgi:two-component system, chemotaxis family, chemotaxis protein CheY